MDVNQPLKKRFSPIYQTLLKLSIKTYPSIPVLKEDFFL